MVESYNFFLFFSQNFLVQETINVENSVKEQNSMKSIRILIFSKFRCFFSVTGTILFYNFLSVFICMNIVQEKGATNPLVLGFLNLLIRNT